jgi:hypothetical protein
VALSLAAIASFAVIGLWGRGQILRGDEWGYATRLVDQSLWNAVVHPPPGKYLIAIPLAYYDLMFHTVGLSHYLPYRLVGIAFLVAAAILLFLYGRRRVGDLLALPAAVLVLFLGGAWELVASPQRLPNQIATVAGLSTLVALDLPGDRRDAAACLLLIVAVTSHPLGLAFVAAAAVLVASRPADQRWRRSWIFLVPIAIYGLWYATSYNDPPHQTHPSGGEVIEFAGKSLAAFCGTVTGFFRPPWTSQIDPVNGISVILAIAFVAGVAWRLRRPSRVPGSTWAVLAALTVLLITPAFAPGATRQVVAPRYLYTGSIVLLLVIFELARGIRVVGAVRAGLIATVATSFTIGMIANLQTLHEKARAYAAASDQLRVELGVLDVARGSFRPPEPTLGQPLGIGSLTQAPLVAPDAPAREPPPELLARQAGTYYRIRDSFGSPALKADQLLEAPQADRERADRLLSVLVRPKVRPGAERASGPLPAATTGPGAGRSSMGDCLRFEPGRGEPSGSGSVGSGPRALVTVELPPGGVTLRGLAPGRPPVVRLGRFSEIPRVPLRVPPGRSATLAPSRGAAPEVPWRTLVLSIEPITVCGRPAP